MRWTEDVTLLVEEMRRVVAFFEWKALWWKKQAGRRQGLAADMREGVTAYSAQQAALYTALKDRCKELWVNVPQMVSSQESAAGPGTGWQAR